MSTVEGFGLWICISGIGLDRCAYRSRPSHVTTLLQNHANRCIALDSEEHSMITKSLQYTSTSLEKNEVDESEMPRH